MSHLCVTGLELPLHVPYKYPLTSSSPPYSWGAYVAQKKKQPLIIPANRFDLLQEKIKTIDTIIFEFRPALNQEERKFEWDHFLMVSKYVRSYGLPVLGITTHPNTFNRQLVHATFVCERPSAPSELDAAIDSCLAMRRAPNKHPYIRARKCSPNFLRELKARVLNVSNTRVDIKAMHPWHREEPAMREKFIHDAGEFSLIRYSEPKFTTNDEGFYLIPNGDKFEDDVLPLALDLYKWREENEPGTKTVFELQVW